MLIALTSFRYGFANGGTIGEDQSQNVISKEEQVAILRRRELKWLDMLKHWDKYMIEQYKKVRQRCRKGIPTSIRPRAWFHLCGAKYRMAREPGAFKRLSEARGEQQWIDDIQKDLHRNFPNHELFGGAYERIGQSELFKVRRLLRLVIDLLDL